MRYCEVCNSKQQEEIYSNVVICKNCRFAYNNHCTQQERSSYYKEMEKKSFYLSKIPLSKLYLKQQESTALFAKEHIKGSALDVGCYTGEVMKLLDRNIEGIDPSKTAVDIARSEGLNVIWGDIFENVFTKKYDTIILSHVLEHIVDLRKFILIISELLNDDGVVIVETPDATKFILEKGKSFVNDQKEPFLQFSYEHVNYFTPYSLKNLFVNFKITYCEHVATTVHALRMVFRKKEDLLIKPSLRCHIEQSFDEMERMNKIIQKIKGPFYVWGLGAFTMKLLEHTELTHKDVRGFIDDVYKEPIFMGIPVIKEPVEDIPILVGSMQYKNYVKKKYKSYKLIEL